VVLVSSDGVLLVPGKMLCDFGDFGWAFYDLG